MHKIICFPLKIRKHISETRMEIEMKMKFSILDHFNEMNESTQSHFLIEIVWLFNNNSLVTHIKLVDGDDWNCMRKIIDWNVYYAHALAWSNR